MNYDHQIDKALNALHAEGRYRVFQDISRINGEYPKANWVQTDGTQTEITDIYLQCAKHLTLYLFDDHSSFCSPI